MVGMAFSNAVAFFIILTAAATLHTHGITNVSTCAQAASALDADRRSIRHRAFRLRHRRHGNIGRAGTGGICSLWDRGGLLMGCEPRTTAASGGWLL